MNKRISPKEQNLIKGALRRVFSRSELRRKVIEASRIEHSDPSRKQVKKWCLCNVCKLPEAISYIVVDHILPVVPLDKPLLEMTATELVDRMWCEENNLQSICPKCHNEKTSLERKERAANKKRKKNVK